MLLVVVVIRDWQNKAVSNMLTWMQIKIGEAKHFLVVFLSILVFLKICLVMMKLFIWLFHM